MDNELKPEEVKEILNKVCRRKTFSSVQPLYINGKWRLAAQGLETAHYYNKFKNNNKDNPSSFVISLPNHDDLEFTTFKENKFPINVDLNDQHRLKHDNLYTNWPQRLKNHCIYLTTDRLHETEAYDLWLRTSAGQLRTFEDFLCFGEAVFGHCINEMPDHPTGEISSYKADVSRFETGNEKVRTNHDMVMCLKLHVAGV